MRFCWQLWSGRCGENGGGGNSSECDGNEMSGGIGDASGEVGMLVVDEVTLV